MTAPLIHPEAAQAQPFSTLPKGESVTLLEFMAGARTLTPEEQASFRAESPLLWGLYFGPSGWLYGDDCKREIRYSVPFFGGLS